MLGKLLNNVQEMISARAIRAGLATLFAGLRDCRAQSTAEQWKAAIATARGHPLQPLIHQCPITNRSFTQPRGYAGDAPLLDLIYGRVRPNGACTELGHAIYERLIETHCASACRERLAFLARRIDHHCGDLDAPRILSVAAGHLREAESSSVVRDGLCQEFVALDQDLESLREVDRCYGPWNVRTIHSSIRPLLRDDHGLGTFDYIYSAGLYDYLAQTTATKLNANLFQMLRPGGSVMIANFLPFPEEIGYMEVYMNWFLTYRKAEHLHDVLSAIPRSEIAFVEFQAERNDNILFMTVTRV